MKVITGLILIALTVPLLAQTQTETEAWQTAKYLGINVEKFPMPQGVSGFDKVSKTAAEFKFKKFKRSLTGPKPRPSYETRPIVKAKAPDGTIYEALCSNYDLKQVWPGVGKDSTNMNTRQQYAPHLGYGYNGPDIYIGKRISGRIQTQLFFRDVGSHTTAPHYISVDSTGQVHLIVSDVNISDDNELNVCSMIGNPATGKWIDAVMLDHRGFTSWSHPWTGSWNDKVYLTWNWGDATFDKNNANMGLFFVDWNSKGYGRKVRVIDGLIEMYDAAVDPISGRIVIVASRDDGVYVISRTADGVWTRPAALDAGLKEREDVSINSVTNGMFIIRTLWNGSEFVVTPMR